MSKINNTIIVGLDIGTTKVVAIAGRKNENNKIEILGYGQAKSAGVQHGVVRNLDHCTRAIQKALEDCKLKYPNLDFKDVYVGIAGHHIKSKQTHGILLREDKESTITKIDVDELLKTQRKTLIPEGEEIIDIIPQEFMVDNHYSTLEPIGTIGSKLAATFHTVTGNKADIKNIKRCVDNSGLNTIDLVLQPLASAAAIMTPQDLEAGVAIIDIGGGTTDMAVFHEGILVHTAVIPYAGANITDDIKKGLKILEEQAEQLKILHGIAIPDEADVNKHIVIPSKGHTPKEISQKNLAHIINSRMEEIFNFVVFELKKVQMENKLYRGIILTGGGSQLKNIVQLCQFVTTIPTRIGIPNEHIAGEGVELFSNPMYATCIGLILRGFDDLENGKFDAENISNISTESSTTKSTSQEPKFPNLNILNNPNLFQSSEEPEVQGPRPQRKMSDLINAKGNGLKRIFSNLKDKFMGLFDDEDDKEELN